MLSFLLFSIIFLVSWFILKQNIKKISINHNVLFIIAHPDDEFMFFGPTLLNELRARIENYYQNIDRIEKNQITKIYLLCLCNGNYNGDGEKRIDESNNALNELFRMILKNSLIVEDISTLSCEDFFEWKIIEDSKIIDSPSIDWNVDHVWRIINDYCQQKNITKIITFDQYGISGHPNHIAIYRTIKKYQNELKNSLKINEIHLLTTVLLLRKYLAVFDIIFTLLHSLFNNNWNVSMINSLKDYLVIVHSLRKYRSQMVWFRRLFYASTSRYMFINSFKIM